MDGPEPFWGRYSRPSILWLYDRPIIAFWVVVNFVPSIFKLPFTDDRKVQGISKGYKIADDAFLICSPSYFVKSLPKQPEILIGWFQSAFLHLVETCNTLLYRVLIFLFSLTHVSTGDCYRFRAVDSESAVRWREAVREAMRPKSKDLMKFEWWVINDESPQSHEAQDGPIYITCHKTTVISLFLFLTKRRIPRKQLPKMSHSLDDSWIMSHYYESWPGCLPFPNLVRQIYLFMF